MRIGILGTGQLGRMMGVAAHRLGIEPVIWGPQDGPACDVTRTSFIADYDDASARDRFVEQVSVVTYELEQLPLAVASELQEHRPVQPAVEALRKAQDRFFEKSLFRELGLPTPAFVDVPDTSVEKRLEQELKYPYLLKTRQGGYDGKGQWKVHCADDLHKALETMQVPCIAESWVNWKREVSVVAVASRDGDICFYDPVENEHVDGILRVSRAPAPNLSNADVECLQDYVRKLIGELHYVGVVAVEFFETDEGWLLNEMAPRVHNSGHWTIEGAETSQFENHVRAVCGLPLGSTRRRGPSAMVNVIGDIPPTDQVLTVPGAALHLYGKTPRPGRKLGHITLIASDDAELEMRLQRMRSIVQAP